MNYEKLTVERFEARLKNGDYKGLTGARRAIGKTDWSKRDKEHAHEVADKHFAANGASSAPKKAATKKTAAPKKAAVKKATPKKAAAAATPKAEPRAPAPPKRSPTTTRTPANTAPAQVVPPAPPILEEVTRQNSASAVISAMRNSGPLNMLEQRAYNIATAEYAENASRAAKRVVETAARGIPTPSPLPKKGETDEAPVETSAPTAVVAPAGAAPRIPVSNGVDTELSPEEKEQLERLERGAAAVPALIGRG